MYDMNYTTNLKVSITTGILTAPAFTALVEYLNGPWWYVLVYASVPALIAWSFFIIHPLLVERWIEKQDQMYYDYETDDEEEDEEDTREFIQVSGNTVKVLDIPGSIAQIQMEKLAAAMIDGANLSRADIVENRRIMNRGQLSKLQRAMANRGLADRLPNNQILVNESGLDWIMSYKKDDPA